eukprot:COSAG01_NODE_526_length_15908_cov_6.178063_12_plen_218_part_00
MICDSQIPCHSNRQTWQPSSSSSSGPLTVVKSALRRCCARGCGQAGRHWQQRTFFFKYAGKARDPWIPGQCHSPYRGTSHGGTATHILKFRCGGVRCGGWSCTARVYAFARGKALAGSNLPPEAPPRTPSQRSQRHPTQCPTIVNQPRARCGALSPTTRCWGGTSSPSPRRRRAAARASSWSSVPLDLLSCSTAPSCSSARHRGAIKKALAAMTSLA